MKNFRALHALRGWRGGVALTALGAVVLAIGLLQTTSSTIVAECPDGSTLVAKFEWDRGEYDFEKPSGNQNVVTITNGTDSGGNWQSTMPISYVIVKGGPGSVITSFAPPQTSGTFTNAGLPKVGRNDNTPDISNIQFCGPTGGGATTTTSTTSTSTTTSTTKAPTTTTSTSTTVAPTTTSTSTTVAPTTTSTSTTTSTTTVDPTTTTTEVDGTTTTSTSTTTVDPTTTTEADGSTTTSTTTTTPDVDDQSVTSSTLVLVEGVVLQQSPDGSVAAQLPRTGSQSGPLVVLGIVLLGIGASFTLVSGLRARRSNG